MKDWEPNPEALQKLLALLDPDPSRAAEAYKLHHRKLVVFFDHRHCQLPEDLADEVFNRVMRDALVEGKIQNLVGYLYGVAKFVYLEYLKRRKKEQAGLAEAARQAEAGGEEPDESDEALQGCFDRCLSELEMESRAFILEYYQNVGGSVADHRREMSERMGVSMNQLRLRAFRVKARLEKCINKCLGKDE
ncbi:MAG TPA: hypothetical protein VGV38_01160 [Pyrinomonadaceae bacterium]|nr:hypothetical protein [Pyrinomonadaceae bacterium]